MSKFSLSRLLGRRSSSPDRSGRSGQLLEDGPQAESIDILKPPADGIHVSPQGALHLQGDSATLAFNSGARHQVQMQNVGSGITVSVVSTQHQGAPELRFSKEFALVQAGAAQAMFAGTVATWYRTLWSLPSGHAASFGGSPGTPQSASRRSALMFVTAGALGAVLVMTGAGMLLSPPTPAIAASSQGAAPAAAAGANNPAAAAAMASPFAAAQVAAETQAAAGRGSGSALQQAKLSTSDLARVNTTAHRIRIREGSAVLSVFSDPNCPACQELEREASGIKAGQGLTIIPVAFQTGSRTLVARVLCSKDPAKAWADAMRGVAPTAQACEAGLRKVDENNTLFGSIGASATPTLMAANGQLAEGPAKLEHLQLFASMYAK